MFALIASLLSRGFPADRGASSAPVHCARRWIRQLGRHNCCKQGVDYQGSGDVESLGVSVRARLHLVTLGFFFAPTLLGTIHPSKAMIRDAPTRSVSVTLCLSESSSGIRIRVRASTLIGITVLHTSPVGSRLRIPDSSGGGEWLGSQSVKLHSVFIIGAIQEGIRDAWHEVHAWYRWSGQPLSLLQSKVAIPCDISCSPPSFWTAHTAVGGGSVLYLFLLNQYAVNGLTGGYVSDLISALQNYMSWLPDVRFKRGASKWDDETEDMNRSAFGRARESYASGVPEV